MDPVIVDDELVAQVERGAVVRLDVKGVAGVGRNLQNPAEPKGKVVGPPGGIE